MATCGVCLNSFAATQTSCVVGCLGPTCSDSIFTSVPSLAMRIFFAIVFTTTLAHTVFYLLRARQSLALDKFHTPTWGFVTIILANTIQLLWVVYLEQLLPNCDGIYLVQLLAITLVLCFSLLVVISFIENATSGIEASEKARKRVLLSWALMTAIYLSALILYVSGIIGFGENPFRYIIYAAAFLVGIAVFVGCIVAIRRLKRIRLARRESVGMDAEALAMRIFEDRILSFVVMYTAGFLTLLITFVVYVSNYWLFMSSPVALSVERGIFNFVWGCAFYISTNVLKPIDVQSLKADLIYSHM
jgi:hypothetical protein